MKKIFFVIVLLTAAFNAKAQYDPMFTQYMFNELFINPAYAGARENLSVNMLVRDQWAGIDGAPKTQTFTIHAPVSNRKIGLGFAVMNETIGVTHRLVLNGDFAYRILMDNATFALGLQGGVTNYQEKFSELKTTTGYDNQFTYNSEKLWLPNAGFGMYYYTNKFYAGLSIPRLIENKVDVTTSTTTVKNVGNVKDWHYYIATGYVFNLNDNIKFKPSIMIKTVQGAPIELDADALFIFNDLFWIGGAYRTGDAVAAIIGLQINRQLRIGYSYDYTLTGLQDYNSGSHEFTLGYDFSFDKNRIITPRYF
ncbi:MAG: type IX secretion system membrane protein PorP/SprF [Bacteroidia bacterium]